MYTNFLVVEQRGENLVVVSSHRVRYRANRTRNRLAVKNVDRVFGTVPVRAVLGQPQNSFKAGDLITPDNLRFETVDGCCSMCCHPFMGKPTGLKFRCFIFRGSPLCEAVKFARRGELPGDWIFAPDKDDISINKA